MMASNNMPPHQLCLPFESLEGQVPGPSHREPCLSRSPAVTVDIHIAVLVAEYACLAHVKRISKVQSQTYVVVWGDNVKSTLSFAIELDST